MKIPAFHFRGSIAVLTGAASGMGEHMAHKLAARGANLILVDRDEPRLASVVNAIEEHRADVSVQAHVADLSEAPEIDDLVSRIRTSAPRISLLINNAGVALGGDFLDVTAEEFDWVQDINFRAPVALCRGLLPALLQQEHAHIANVSSVFGLIGPPGNAAYCSSKYAVRGFSEVLRHEMAPHGIGVTTVFPGGIRTRIAETARVAAVATPEQEAEGKEAFAKRLTYPADRAAKKILDGIEDRKGRVLIAPSASIPDAAARLFPVRYGAVLQRLDRLQGRSLPTAKAAVTTASSASRATS